METYDWVKALSKIETMTAAEAERRLKVDRELTDRRAVVDARCMAMAGKELAEHAPIIAEMLTGGIPPNSMVAMRFWHEDRATGAINTGRGRLDAYVSWYDILDSGLLSSGARHGIEICQGGKKPSPEFQAGLVAIATCRFQPKEDFFVGGARIYSANVGGTVAL